MNASSPITRNTTIQIGLVIALAVCVWSVAMAYSNITHSLQNLSKDVGALTIQMDMFQLKLDDAASDRWKKQDMQSWSYELAENNPELYVPNPATSSRGKIIIPD